jgi:uncharacterized membrane protein YdbT with pleckstrin-like domain
MPEETIWSGPSSHVKNFWPYVLCGVLSPLVVPLFIGLWKWLALRSRVYRITTERLLTTEGVLNKTTDSLELYRVRDIRVIQPLWQRMFGLETIELDTSDETTPLVRMDYLPADLHLADKMREQVEACRVAKRVRDLDIDFPPQ